MNLVFLGAVALLIILLSVRWLAHTEPRNVKIAGGLGLTLILVLLAILMALTGRVLASLPLLVGALAAYRRYRQLRRAAEYLGGKFGAGAGGGASRSKSGAMTHDEALRVLGLEEGASNEKISEVHRSLMQKLHPDHGGTDYLAAKLNEAREVLMGR